MSDLKTLDAQQIKKLYADWQVWARDDQLPPATTQDGQAWFVWLVLGGRGAGKTRTGAEWVRAKALGVPPVASQPAQRIALVGETIADVRNVMVEGHSGLLSLEPAEDRPKFEPSKQRVIWPNGSVGQMFSAENPEGLRGPQFDAAWCDEIAKWRRAELTWDMLQFGLRLGAHPQVVVTTTPRPIDLLKRLIEDSKSVVSRVRTTDNAVNLAPSFVEEMKRRYAGTALGRQELFGEIIDDVEGRLWRKDWIDKVRVETAPQLRSIVVAVDPPVTATANSDACGIIVAGKGDDDRVFILADKTVQGKEPSQWARRVLGAHEEFCADRVVAEVNQGGDLVATMLRQINRHVVVRNVRATRGKWVRAEPVAALYAEGQVVHVGQFDALEEQMCAFGTDGKVGGRSPDRVDALVWAITDLLLRPTTEPQIRAL